MPVRSHPLLVLAALLPVLLLAGCGDDAPSAAPTTAGATSTATAPADTTGAAPTSAAPSEVAVPASFPCDAVTTAEVGAVAGDTYTAKVGPSGQCEYKPSDVRGKPDVAIEIPPGEFDLSGVTGAKNVPGIGVSAYVRREPDFPSVTIARVQLDAAGKVVEVSVTGGDETQRDGYAETLLKLAFGKL